MIRYFFEQFKQNRSFQVTLFTFIALTVWWISIYFRGLTEGFENDLFTNLYGLMSLIGGIIGIKIARKWGGFKSILGSSIYFLAFGLLAQFVGQMLYGYYIYVLGIAEPYPSVGDISFFASVVLYVFAVIYLSRVTGFRLFVATPFGKLSATVIAALILGVSYWIQLRGYVPDFSDPVLLFFDFGFPIGQALFVAITIMIWYGSRNILGGMMKAPVLLLLAALVFQYLADFSYSYQAAVAPENLYVGDYLDYLYLLSYFLMSVALIHIGNMFYKVQDS